MDTEKLSHGGVHHCSKRKTSETFHKFLKDFFSIFLDALFLEGEVFREELTLVVPAEEEDIMRMFQFQGEEIQTDLHRERTAVDVIPKEEVSVVSTNLVLGGFVKDVKQVVKLAMEVPNDMKRLGETENSGFLVNHSGEVGEEEMDGRSGEGSLVVEVFTEEVNVGGPNRKGVTGERRRGGRGAERRGDINIFFCSGSS